MNYITTEDIIGIDVGIESAQNVRIHVSADGYIVSANSIALNPCYDPKTKANYAAGRGVIRRHRRTVDRKQQRIGTAKRILQAAGLHSSLKIQRADISTIVKHGSQDAIISAILYLIKHRGPKWDVKGVEVKFEQYSAEEWASNPKNSNINDVQYYAKRDDIKAALFLPLISKLNAADSVKEKLLICFDFQRKTTFDINTIGKCPILKNEFVAFKEDIFYEEMIFRDAVYNNYGTVEEANKIYVACKNYKTIKVSNFRRFINNVDEQYHETLNNICHHPTKSIDDIIVEVETLKLFTADEIQDLYVALESRTRGRYSRKIVVDLLSIMRENNYNSEKSKYIFDANNGTKYSEPRLLNSKQRNLLKYNRAKNLHFKLPRPLELYGNPKVKKTIDNFYNLLETSINKYGFPTKVIIELTREESDAKSKLKIEEFIKNKESHNESVYLLIDSAFGTNNPNKSLFQKVKLWIEQRGHDPYSGEMIAISDLLSGKYEIDHIMKQANITCDAWYNLILTKKSENQKKEFDFQDQRKKAIKYLNYLKGHTTWTFNGIKFNISPCKDKLENLTQYNVDFIDTKSNLVDTSYVAKHISKHLKEVFSFLGLQTTVRTVKNKFVGAIRKKLSLPPKDRTNYTHHLEDCLFLALYPFANVKKINSQSYHLNIPFDVYSEIDKLKDEITYHHRSCELKGEIHEETLYSKSKFGGVPTCRKFVKNIIEKGTHLISSLEEKSNCIECGPGKKCDNCSGPKTRIECKNTRLTIVNSLATKDGLTFYQKHGFIKAIDGRIIKKVKVNSPINGSDLDLIKKTGGNSPKDKNRGHVLAYNKYIAVVKDLSKYTAKLITRMDKNPMCHYKLQNGDMVYYENNFWYIKQIKLGGKILINPHNKPQKDGAKEINLNSIKKIKVELVGELRYKCFFIEK